MARRLLFTVLKSAAPQKAASEWRTRRRSKEITDMSSTKKLGLALAGLVVASSFAARTTYAASDAWIAT